MNATAPRLSVDHGLLLDTLSRTDNLLVIQDLDGVCMGLVRDPLTRRIDRAYVEATRQMAGHFYVLTNGEHIGSRGLNAIVDQLFDTPAHAAEQGFYLPGLAGGGVQLQDRHGRVSHPGVSEAELEFLKAVPARATAFLRARLADAPYRLDTADIERLVASAVLDNLVSPTVNINEPYRALAARPDAYVQLQRDVVGLMEELLRDAQAQSLGQSFFVHYAPNLGRDADGNERVRYSDGRDAGTTDFQFMLKGAIKEVGVLVILNHYLHARTGRWPLGEHFNAREAPREHDALLQLAAERLDPAEMPRIVGVGDTVTSHAAADGTRLRGGSDRGYLALVQDLGVRFGTDNAVLFIDSSGGEVRRPGLDAAHLARAAQDAQLAPWPALDGISDAEDPLTLNYVFPGGHTQYVAFFRELARRRAPR